MAWWSDTVCSRPDLTLWTVYTSGTEQVSSVIVSHGTESFIILLKLPQNRSLLDGQRYAPAGPEQATFRDESSHVIDCDIENQTHDNRAKTLAHITNEKLTVIHKQTRRHQ